jgi:hypothetical protein
MASITLDDGEAKARINAFLEKRGPKTGPLSAEGQPC